MDRIDRAILGALRRNGRLSFRELGVRANLSANAVAERVRRLVTAGVIRGFHADIDPAAFGFHMSVYVDVKTGAKSGPEEFRKLVAGIPEVRRAVWTTGQFDFTLELTCKDQTDLVRIIEFLRTHAGIRETSTRLICMELNSVDRAPPDIDEGE
ncbi:MAG TPA: Lrp/AsnC family transcriptional regulator [Stellaceae bacterium]|jgi:Lrp/AsnC family leucine-responsive transcriptional regulator|nr:Lrp/AsnC family transcriptional regulator [Stellaceae bacterium]